MLSGAGIGPKTMASRQWEWKVKQLKRGRCCACGNKRGRHGTGRLCRECADKASELKRLAREKEKREVVA